MPGLIEFLSVRWSAVMLVLSLAIGCRFRLPTSVMLSLFRRFGRSHVSLSLAIGCRSAPDIRQGFSSVAT